MIKRIYVIAILCIMALLFFVPKTYAKYVLSGSLSMEIYIDKTPPIIDVTNKDGSTESYPQTTSDVIKKNDDVILNTRDNVKIDYNEYYYNPTDNNFDGKTPTRFDNGKKLEDEGYYKIIAVDTSNNKTEIIILIDKTPPEVTVKFYKKGQISLIRNLETEGLYNG